MAHELDFTTGQAAIAYVSGSPTPWHGLGQTDDVDPGLEGVIAGDQAHIAAADDEQPLGRTHEVSIGQRLKGAGAVDPDQVVVVEAQHQEPNDFSMGQIYEILVHFLQNEILD